MRVLMRLALLIPLACVALPAAAQPPQVAASDKSLMQQAVDRFTAKDQGARIISGTKAAWKDHQWQVALVYAKDSDNLRAQFCGGTIIAPGWVVTAAHCIDPDYAASDYQVLSNTASLVNGGQRSRISTYTVHEGWRVEGNKSQYDNDIALLKIDPATPLKGTPLPLVAAGTRLENRDVLVSGWGVTEFRPTGSEDLMQVTVPSVTPKICNEKKAYNGAVTGNMFCAGAYKKDSCQGDSGGPASAIVQGKRRLVGVVSWGIGCGLRDKYGVYTRLPLYVDWIAQHTNGDVK